MLLLLSLAFTVAYVDDSDFDYEVISKEDKTCMITGYTGNDAGIVIPEQQDIEGNVVAMLMNVMGGEENVEGIECTFADGALNLLVPASYNDAGMQLTEEIVYSINVLQDGTLSFRFDMMGMPIIFYLNPMAAEEIPAA